MTASDPGVREDGHGKHGRYSGDEVVATEHLRERSDDALLSVRNLETRFDTEAGTIRAVDGISFDIQEGEILGIVGESGCGKSVTSLSITRLINSPGYINDGEIWYDGTDLLELFNEEIRRLRGKEISMIFQEPMQALNPVFDIGWQVGEPLHVHEDISRGASRKRAIELLRQVDIPSPEHRIDEYPHQFSSGMRQRAMIAMALACEPRLLIADEPTTALDVTIQAEILDLIRELNEDLGMAVMLITHNLGVVAELCDKVAVMYAGRIVEYTDVETLFEDPRHPYTRGLVNCVPNPLADDQDLSPISGEVPDLSDPPSGCNFRDRCPYAVEECTEVDPGLREVDDDHYSACIWRDPE